MTTEEQHQEFFNEIMNDYQESMDRYYKEVNRVNNRISKSIKYQFGESFAQEIMLVAEECEVNGKWEIVERTTGKYQEEDGYYHFKGYWVDQWSVDDSGDSFNGYIYIQLKENKWLKMFYSC